MNEIVMLLAKDDDADECRCSPSTSCGADASNQNGEVGLNSYVPNNEERPSFTSPLIRSVLNQHLRQTNPELTDQRNVQLLDDMNSDALSEASSASGGNRSSLSWALSRLNGALGDSRATLNSSGNAKKEYSRTHSNRELGNSTVSDGRRYQRYGRASTLENIDPGVSVTSAMNAKELKRNSVGRLGSPSGLSDDEQSGSVTPTSYRTYTRTCSREYLSPNSSRGTSPSPSSNTTAATGNPIMTQLSTVLETVNETDSPRPVRAVEKRIPVAVVTSTSSVIANSTSNHLNSTAAQQSSNPSLVNISTDKKPRRISRFLRPDFFDSPNDNNTTSSTTAGIPVGNVTSPESLSISETKGNESAKQRFLKSIEKRWEKYNTDQPSDIAAKPLANESPFVPPLSLVKQDQNVVVTEPIAKNLEKIARPVSPPKPFFSQQSATVLPSVAIEQNSSVEAEKKPLLLLQQIESNKPLESSKKNMVSENPVERANPCREPVTNKTLESQPIPVSTIGEQQPGTAKGKVDSSTKNSPKLNVRRQFEHLLNLAAAQFQRSLSPSKTTTKIPKPAAVDQEAISMELKQLEDDIKNAAIARAEAAAKIDAALKSGHSLKYNSSGKPALPAKPDFLIGLKPTPSTKNAPEASVQESSHRSGAGRWELTSLSSIAISDDLGEKPQGKGPGQLLYSSSESRSNSAAKNGTGSVALNPDPKVLSNTILSPGTEEKRGLSPLPPVVNGAKTNGEDEDIRFARIKRVSNAENYDYSDDVPGTPTDSYESSSVCSDFRDRDLRETGDDESVSERILRKSFYNRFNEPSKKKHRRSTTKDLLDLSSKSTNNSGSHIYDNSNLPPKLPTKTQRLSSRDESAESMMVRKFLSRTDSADPVTLERERRISLTRRQMSDVEDLVKNSSTENDNRSEVSTLIRSSVSRENSVARSVRSEMASPPMSPLSDSVHSNRDSRSYSRTFSSRLLSAENPSATSDNYNSNSLNRRSYYSSNSDHSVILPRLTNRYSIHEPDISRGSSSYSSATLRNPNTRTSYVPATSRYSSIFEESGRDSSLLSPTSSRRTSGLSDLSPNLAARRETTFYGVPNSRDSSLSRREGPSSSFFMRSTSTGLDYGTTSAPSSSSSTYATMRPSSYLRHKR